MAIESGDLKQKFDAAEPGVELAQAEPAFTLADARSSDLAQIAPSQSGTGDSFYPSTPEARRQEFVDGFGRLGKMYHDAVGDDSRFSAFQTRMQGVYQFDPGQSIDRHNFSQ